MSVSRSMTLALALAAAAALASGATPTEAAGPSKPVRLPMVSIDDNPKVNEGTDASGKAVITVRLSAASTQEVKVKYATVEKTAKASVDFTAAADTLTFAPGETTKTVEVEILGDKLDEDTEHFFVELSEPVGARLGKKIGNARIFDDDAPPAFTVSDATVAEGNDGTTDASFTVSLSAPSSKRIAVRYAAADGTAKAASGDYGATSGALTFLPGETSKTVVVKVKGDATDEPDETFSVKLSAPVNATIADGEGVGTITDDD